MPVKVLRKIRRLTFPNAFISVRAIIGLSVPLWWQEDLLITYIFLGSAVNAAWIAWFLEPGYKTIPYLSRALNPIADKLFILPIFWFVGLTTLNWPLLVLAGYTTLYDIAITWQRRIATSLAWQGVQLLQLPTTALSRTKTVCQYVLTFMLAAPDIDFYTTVAIIFTMIMTVVAWSSHRHQGVM